MALELGILSVKKLYMPLFSWKRGTNSILFWRTFPTRPLTERYLASIWTRIGDIWAFKVFVFGKWGLLSEKEAKIPFFL